MFTTVAWGVVAGGTGNLFNERNLISTRTGVGVYELGISENFSVDSQEAMVTVTPRGGGNGAAVDVFGVSDTLYRVEMFNPNTGMPMDKGFYFEIKKLDIL